MINLKFYEGAYENYGSVERNKTHLIVVEASFEACEPAHFGAFGPKQINSIRIQEYNKH